MFLVFAIACARPELGREYTEPIDILDAAGVVQARGWAREPLFGFSRDAVPDGLRDAIREWDFYAVNTPEFAVNVTLAELDVAGADLVLASVKVHDYGDGVARGPDLFLVDADDSLSFEPDPDGTYAIASGAGTLSYAMEGDDRVITFVSGDDHGELRIGARTGDSVALVTPFADEGRFFYEDKALGMTSSGTVVAGGKTYIVPEGSLGTMDFARSVMPDQVTWDWSTAVGTVDGRAVAVNLGSVFGDETGGTPNAVLVDGVLHKLGRVDWSYALDDVRAPWSFSSGDGRVDLTLTGDRAYAEQTDTQLGAYHVQLWKLYGVWSGTIELDDGETLAIDGLLGGAEHLQTDW